MLDAVPISIAAFLNTSVCNLNSVQILGFEALVRLIVIVEIQHFQ